MEIPEKTIRPNMTQDCVPGDGGAIIWIHGDLNTSHFGLFEDGTWERVKAILKCW